MGYIKCHCPKCKSHNITPTNKIAHKGYDTCDYVCVTCGHEFGPVVYWRK